MSIVYLNSSTVRTTEIVKTKLRNKEKTEQNKWRNDEEVEKRRKAKAR